MIKLKELFDKSYPYRKDSDSGYSGYFNSGFQFETPYGDLYKVTFMDMNFDEIYTFVGNTIYDVLRKSGYEFEDHAIDIEFGKLKPNGYGLLTYEISPTRDYIKVLGTIIEIIKNSNIPDETPIVFSAKEKSRIKLYDTLANKFKRSGDTLYTTFNSKGSKYYFLMPTK